MYFLRRLLLKKFPYYNNFYSSNSNLSLEDIDIDNNSSSSTGMNNNSIYYNQISTKEKQQQYSNNSAVPNKISHHFPLHHHFHHHHHHHNHHQHRRRHFSSPFHHHNHNHRHKLKRPKKSSWSRFILCGILVFALYFLFLGFITYLAILSYRTSSSTSVANRPEFELFQNKNGLNSLMDSEYKLISANGSLYMTNGLISLEKLGNMKFDSNVRRISQRNGLVAELLRSQLIFKCKPIHFRDGKLKHPTVALVSFPGSGNTWLRYLIQMATGIFTGSIYKDFELIRNGFLGENLRDSRVLTVKTHDSGPEVFAQFQKAILLIRRPAEAIQAEFNRHFNGHVGHADLAKYRQNKGRFWSHFVYLKGNIWTRLNYDWIEYFDGPLLIMMYNQLVSNVSNELTDVLDFLHEPITPEIMNCVLRNQEGIYRREKKYPNLNPFTRQMELYLSKQETIIIDAIQRRIKRKSEKLHKYLNSSSETFS